MYRRQSGDAASNDGSVTNPAEARAAWAACGEHEGDRATFLGWRRSATAAAPSQGSVSSYSESESDLPVGAALSRGTHGRRRRAKSPGSDGSALSLLGQINSLFGTCEDTLNELSDSYSFEVRPELVVKLRKRTPWVTLGARYEAQAGRTELVAKQGERELPLWRVVRRVVVAPERGDVRVHSSRLSLGIFGVEAVYTHDLASGTPGLSWRVSSAWDAGLTHVGRKQRLPAPFPGTLKPSARWDVATLKPPDLNGRMGAGAPGLALELGKFHCSLPRCQLAVEL